MSNTTDPKADPAGELPARPLTPQAQRALAEAEERRRASISPGDTQPPEVGGRAGPDPARYGDWENKGIVSDF